MRCKILVFCALLTCSAVAAMAQAPGAFTLSCGKPIVSQEITKSTLIGTFNCTSTATVNGLPFKGLTFSSYALYGASENNVWGVIVGALTNGDQVFFEYHNIVPVRNGATGIGNFSYKIVGGTGSANGIAGSGSCKAETTPDGSQLDCVGVYATR
jgi:hypothetical protein